MTARKQNSITGFTFFEILLATFILSVIMVGLTSVFISAKKLIRHNKARVVGAEAGKLFLDPFQMMVRNDTWSEANNTLSNGTSYSNTTGTPSLDRDYTATYSFGSVTGVNNLTRVTAVINWTESNAP
ncbi:MAG: hypothetical protein WC532_01175 [Candidatus Omnitrophota bacterium]